ncbi:hypothetical protein [Companilactobacillus furfuricola]|uniref:hypothetical protein n=1 Tax=Companilactobacillus furfuricola TaxID=1462575 RepID=UPI000F79E278|nr:hypothetical protein [Companilactobacillus furfuricola]
MDLKFGGSDVKSLMYKDKDVSGSQMLESGTILLLLDKNINWAKRILGLSFTQLKSGYSITCKAFGVEKDWKNVSQIRVEAININGYVAHGLIDISELKNGPCYIAYGDFAVTLEGNELTFTSKGKYAYESILVEAYNE